MNGWLFFILFTLVGLGMLCAGIFYMHKEKNDPESVKIYRVVAILGAVMAAVAITLKFVF